VPLVLSTLFTPSSAASTAVFSATVTPESVGLRRPSLDIVLLIVTFSVGMCGE